MARYIASYVARCTYNRHIYRIYACKYVSIHVCMHTCMHNFVNLYIATYPYDSFSYYICTIYSKVIFMKN